MSDAEYREVGKSRALFLYVRRVVYRDACTRTPEEQAQLLERLRYHTYPETSLRQRVMQRLGDVGRQLLPWLVRSR